MSPFAYWTVAYLSLWIISLYEVQKFFSHGMLPFFLMSALCISSTHLASLLTVDPSAKMHDTKCLYFASWSLRGPISSWLSRNYFSKKLFIHLAALGLHCCTWAFSHCVSRAQQLRHTGPAVPRPEECSRSRHRTCVPALAGRFSTTAPPGSP